MKKYILAGDLPYLVMIILCTAAFFFGRTTVEPTGKFAIAEKSAIVLQAVLDRPFEPAETITHEVAQPIIAVLKNYSDQGYTIIDAAKDDQGNYAIIALPKTTIDITDALRAAIKPTQPAQGFKENIRGTGK